MPDDGTLDGNWIGMERDEMHIRRYVVRIQIKRPGETPGPVCATRGEARRGECRQRTSKQPKSSSNLRIRVFRDTKKSSPKHPPISQPINPSILHPIKRNTPRLSKSRQNAHGPRPPNSFPHHSLTLPTQIRLVPPFYLTHVCEEVV